MRGSSALRRRYAVERGFWLLAALAVTAVLAGCGGTKTVTETVTVTSPATTGLGPPREWAYFGHVKSLTRSGDHYEMRFDPTLFLSGETANKAAAEDGVIAPGEPMPNDNYRVEEGHRLYTYIVPSDAKVTVVTNSGDPPQLGSTRISVAELAKIVGHTSTMRLFEPLDTGVWLTIRGDRVLAIEHQYVP